MIAFMAIRKTEPAMLQMFESIIVFAPPRSGRDGDAQKSSWPFPWQLHNVNSLLCKRKGTSARPSVRQTKPNGNGVRRADEGACARTPNCAGRSRLQALGSAREPQKARSRSCHSESRRFQIGIDDAVHLRRSCIRSTSPDLRQQGRQVRQEIEFFQKVELPRLPSITLISGYTEDVGMSEKLLHSIAYKRCYGKSNFQRKNERQRLKRTGLSCRRY
jgi:hypothetical protein